MAESKYDIEQTKRLSALWSEWLRITERRLSIYTEIGRLSWWHIRRHVSLLWEFVMLGVEKDTVNARLQRQIDWMTRDE